MEAKFLSDSPEFKAALESFINAAQAKINEHFAKNLSNLTPDVLVLTAPKSNTKFIRVEKHNTFGSGVSSYCFIDRANGNVLKAESWKKPHPTPRGNIFDEYNGQNAVTVYGATYLK